MVALQRPQIAAAPASGGLEVRLARSRAEIDQAQALRYRVFFDEMGARPGAQARLTRRDADVFDAHADHLLVVDRDAGAVVGTYRLLRREAAEKAGGFYSAAEFDLAPILAWPRPVLELGRSCVDARYRGRATMQLLWQGIAAYVETYDIGLLFGCASLPGIDPAALAPLLGFLWRHCLAPDDLRARPHDGRRVEMRPADGAPPLDGRQGLAALPPLVKGYLRVGGCVGDGAVVDAEFNTTDVLMIVDRDRVAARYREHFLGGGTEACA